MIGVNNLTKGPVDKIFFKKIIGEVLRKEKKTIKEISIVLVGEERMKQINRRYKKRNKVTDVLAFSQTQRFHKDIFKGGEIVICPRVVRKNAKIFNQSFKKELAKVLIHSILHLLGYDHTSGKDARKMEEKENYYLNLNIT